MARPLPLPDQHRSGTNGNLSGRPAPAGPLHLHSAVAEEPQPPEDISAAEAATIAPAEAEQLLTENEQLRALCEELEQALQEATQHLQPDLEQQIREYDAVLEEKNEMIRQLHQQLHEAKATLEEKASQPAPPPPRQHQGPAPCEDELLALSEELERERRQLQEDEQTLMQQMREMEVGMARERAELARQRNDLQRLQAEIRHDLERLERNGAVQSKIENLKIKLQDATARRGAAPGPTGASSGQSAAPARKEGLMGRLFGQGK
jgi:chromosome segregation ATPase